MKNCNLKTKDIYARYREILKKPQLSKEEIDKMRPHIQLIARTICEHVWGKEFY